MFIARCRAIACYGSQSITDITSNAYARCRAIACYGSQLSFERKTIYYPHTSIFPTNENYANNETHTTPPPTTTISPYLHLSKKKTTFAALHHK